MKHCVRILVPLVVLLLTGLVAAPAFGQDGDGDGQEPAYEAWDGEITAARLNVRAAADNQSRILRILEQGDRVRVLGEDDGWLRIGAAGVRAWVRLEYLEQVQDDSWRTTGDDVRYRASNSFDHPSLGTLDKGSEVTVVRTLGKWAEIEAPEGASAWVYGEYVRRADGSAPDGGLERGTDDDDDGDDGGSGDEGDDGSGDEGDDGADDGGDGQDDGAEDGDGDGDAVPDHPAARLAPESAAALARANALLIAGTRGKPAEWDLGPAREAFQALVESDDAELVALAEDGLAEIEARVELAVRIRDARMAQAERERRLAEIRERMRKRLETMRDTHDVDVTGYDAVGRVEYVAARRRGRAARFQLVREGRPVAYLQAADRTDINLHEWWHREVAVAGRVVQLEEDVQPLILVESIARLHPTPGDDE